VRNIELINSTRDILRAEIAGSKDVTLFRLPGNIGDQLIHAGTKQLLCDMGVHYVQRHIAEAVTTADGEVALVGGSGGWCHPHHLMPSLIAPVEERFERTIVLPSSFDVTEPNVGRWIDGTDSCVMTRDWVSHAQLSSRCKVLMAADGAFFFDYEPFRRVGIGTLNAFRTDNESRFLSRPSSNVDISCTCSSLDEWLETISRSGEVMTDRAHVMIASAMLGKTVGVWESSYHKLGAIADTMGLSAQMHSGGLPV